MCPLCGLTRAVFALAKGHLVQALSWNGQSLSFSINVGLGANGLQAMVPAQSGGKTLTSLTLNGAPISFSLQVLKGVQWATFPAVPGTYQAMYP